jgi:hypothetical protein
MPHPTKYYDPVPKAHLFAFGHLVHPFTNHHSPFTSPKPKVILRSLPICFDDWCATITKAEQVKTIGAEKSKGQFVIVHIRVSNHARGIAQKPSEPRLHLIDGQGHSWSVSEPGQRALNNLSGEQFPLDGKLELHQSIETRLVFDIPINAKNVKGLIEEGPFITKLLLQDNKEVFELHY